MLKSIGWSVFVFFSSAFGVLLRSVSRPWQRFLREKLSIFLFVLSPSLERFRFGLYCCRHDFSDFLFVLWLDAFDQAGRGGEDPSALVFECGLDSYVHSPRAFPSFPLKLLVAPTLLVSILHGTFV